MSLPTLLFAVQHYDRFIPFLDGTIRESNGFLLNVQHGRRDRHGSILRGEFDLGEMSLSSFVMAKARNLPFTAIPAFPRRLFSQSQIWINSQSSIRTPKDLIGKKVGLGSFQTTLSVLAKGDLQSDYDVPWRSIEWIVSGREAVPFVPEAGVKISKIPEGKNNGDLLLNQEIAAIFSPNPPKQALVENSPIRRLFADPRAEETRYFKKYGYFPIMHIIIFRNDVLEKYPEAASAVLVAFNKAEEISAKYYEDANWSRLAWGRLNIEEEAKALSSDLWPVGFKRNRDNLQRFIGFSKDQGLIDWEISAESLFASSTLDT